MDNYMDAYSFEKKGDGVVAKLEDNPVAEYDLTGKLTKIINWASLPVEECVPSMIQRSLMTT